MYVGTIFEYDDQSQIAPLPVRSVPVNPLYLCLFTSDKGPEDWTVLKGRDWFTTYGENISFEKHGQPLLQAAISINAGATLLSKRLVADDATLANVSIIAKLSQDTIQATNSVGQLLFIDENGQDTVEDTGTPKMIKRCIIKYELRSIAGLTVIDPKFVYDEISSQLGANEFLLYTITDNGRGTSNKRFMIYPNYRISKGKNYIEYYFGILENSKTLERLNFAPINNLIVNRADHSLQAVITTNSQQVLCYQDNKMIDDFINAIATMSEKTVDEIKGVDFLFGYNSRSLPVDFISVDPTGINIRSSFGQALQNGTNGAFGSAPIQNEDEYVLQAEYALGVDSTSVYDPDIYDRDKWMIEVAIDANYFEGVKRAIETLVTFREDFEYLRDMGVNMANIDMIEAKANLTAVNNKFIPTYCTAYDIIDPYARKQITVTIGMALAELMIGHLINHRNAAVAGIRYGMIIKNAIRGTLLFKPTICPDPVGNQKEVMEELRVNYATYIGDDLVIETEYTSQDEHTQLTYLNNMLILQDLMRAIRRRCPIIRYAFLDGEDLDEYKNDILGIIENYRRYFKMIDFIYTNDQVYVNNKIFYATIVVAFRDFVQTEWFVMRAINIDTGEVS